VRREVDCRLCAEWPAGLTEVQSAVWLDGSARDLVHLLKYEGWWRAVEAMAHRMLPLGPLARAGVLVPTPLAASRLRHRGYNQAERLAREIGCRRGLPVRPELLLRRRDTRTQTALTPEARRANIAGAFLARGVRGRRVIVVDDVFTTGATLVACAEALLEAGASEVGAITFARAVLPVR
jgi:ComF family protein